MTTAELRAAATNYINWNLPNGHPQRGFCEWRLSDSDSAYRHRDEACEAMARHILATVHADDDEPVTEDWLRANRFLPSGEDEIGKAEFGIKIWDTNDVDDYGTEPGMQLLFDLKEQSVWLETYGTSGDTLCLVELGKKNRGELRQLMACLGRVS